MKVYVLFALVVAIQCRHVRFRKCEKVEIEGTVSVVSLLPCYGRPCILHGGNYTVAVTFKPTKDANKTNVKLAGKVIGIWFSLPLSDDACKLVGNDTYPLRGGNTYTLAMDIHISRTFRMKKVPVRVEIENTDGTDIVCVVFPVQIK